MCKVKSVPFGTWGGEEENEARNRGEQAEVLWSLLAIQRGWYRWEQTVTMWDDARAYDLATGAFTSDIAYWQALVAECRPHRVLDLACGTGRITLPLAETGADLHDDFAIVGIDTSGSFLRRAAEKGTAAGLSERVQWVEGDM